MRRVNDNFGVTEPKLILLSGGNKTVIERDAVDFFENELLGVSPLQAVSAWNMDFLQDKFKELVAIGTTYGVDCNGASLGSIVREIREKQANGKSVS